MMVKARMSRRRAVKTIRVTFGTDSGEAEELEEGATAGVGLLPVFVVLFFADMRVEGVCVLLSCTIGSGRLLAVGDDWYLVCPGCLVRVVVAVWWGWREERREREKKGREEGKEREEKGKERKWEGRLDSKEDAKRRSKKEKAMRTRACTST